MAAFPLHYHHATTAPLTAPYLSGFSYGGQLIELLSDVLGHPLEPATEALVNEEALQHTSPERLGVGRRLASGRARASKKRKGPAGEVINLEVEASQETTPSGNEPVLAKSPSSTHVQTLDIEAAIVSNAQSIYPGRNEDRPIDVQLKYEALLDLLTSAVEPATPVDLLALVDHQLRLTPTPNLKSKRNHYPKLDLMIQGRRNPLITFGLEGDNAQWDMVAGASAGFPPSRVGIPSHWLPYVLALNAAAQPSPGRISPRAARYYIESNAKIYWVQTEGHREIRLLVTAQTFVDLSVSLFDHMATTPRFEDVEADRFILHSLFPPDYAKQRVAMEPSRKPSLRAFYGALTPAPALPPLVDERSLQSPHLLATLLPFQRRTVAWLLHREGADVDGYALPIKDPFPPTIWERIDLGEQSSYMYCRATGEVVKALDHDKCSSVRASAMDWNSIGGSLLSEEMGLGKTMEAISLILLHPHPLSSAASLSSNKIPTITNDGAKIEPSDIQASPFDGHQQWDEDAKLFVETVGTTLVVTPAALLPQWLTEMQTHAPTLKVCVYRGWRSLASRDLETKELSGDEEAFLQRASVIGAEGDMASEPMKQRLFIDFVRRHDVVLTTYAALSEDVTVARAIPPRSRRANVEYRENERPRSPLVMAKWWRVCMDEVQLQGDRVSAEMVSLIPRQYSLAISGTPAKAGTNDLIQTLRFLRVPVVPDAPKLWDRLQQPLFHSALTELFSQIAVRTTKADIQRELSIPPQKRMVIPIDLSNIEMHYYLETLDSCRQALGIDSVGQPLGSDWQLDASELRMSLWRLRQICTHLQVGQLGRVQADAGRRWISLGRELMTLEAALEKMLFDHQQNQLSVLRGQLVQSVRKGQLLALDESDELRLLKAGTVYANVCAEAEKAMALLRETITSLQTEGVAADVESNESDDASGDEDDDPQNREEKRQRRAKIFAAQSTIREFMLVLHQATFFSGDVAHMKGDEAAENEYYEKADQLRADILRVALRTAQKSTHSVGSTINDFSMLEIEPREDETGIHSKTIMENANHLIELLNDNAELLWNWRGKIVSLLATPLEAPPALAGKPAVDEIPEKDFYQIALDAQGEIEAYLAAYASALADRREMLMEERSLLQQHEARLQGQVITRVGDAGVENADGESAKLLRELTVEREAIMKSRRNKKPLKTALLLLNDIRNKAVSDIEAVLAKNHAIWVRSTVLKQGSYVERLLKEVDNLRSAFNTRVGYFAALQVISDSVEAPVIEKSIREDLAKVSASIDETEVQLARLASRTRYLKSLGKQQEQPDFTRDDCVICWGASEDAYGCLLSCGHAFCERCFRRHCQTTGSRKCPMCKTAAIDRRAVTRFRYREESSTHDKAVHNVQSNEPISETLAEAEPEAIAAEEVIKADEAVELARDLEKLEVMPPETRQAIAECDMIGDFGAKIDFLVKHLHYLAMQDPDARHIVFSNWRDSLKIVATALTQNGIKYVSLDQDSKTRNVAELFKKDKSISVFLLHAEKESSGLTLTAARMVHLLEPVLAHGFELQAIGRVDRLGQKHETTVFCYSTMDTVESRILVRGIRRGESIYLKKEVAATVAHDSAQISMAAKKGGDASAGDARDLLELLC